MSAMTRQALIEKCFQRGSQLTLANDAYRESIATFLNWLIVNDHIDADVTTAALKLSHRTTAEVRAKQGGVVAGLEEALFLLKQYPAISVEACAEDGSTVSNGATILALSLDIRQLLGLERTLLNVIGRMSGIATQTRRLVGLAGQQSGGPQVAGTRKTPWMMLDKKAVWLGGGLTHRLSLGDAILVKDNHLAAFSRQTGNAQVEDAIPQAINLLIQASQPPRDFFEIEVETAGQGVAALTAFEAAWHGSIVQPTMIVMLDNFSPALATQFVRDARKTAVYEHVLFEASGDITEETIPAWSKTGVDVLSVGALSHSVKTLNVSMALR